MAKAILNQFDGGLAQDNRTFSTNQYADSVNFDMLTLQHYLTPYKDFTDETMISGTINDHRITDVDSMTTSGTTWVIGLGRESSVSFKATFFKKDSSTDITDSWTSYATGLGTVMAGTLAVYRSKGYCIRDTGTQNILVEWDGSATASDVASNSGLLGGYSSTVPRPFEHPEDKVLYMGAGNIISKLDNTTFTPTALTLPADKVITSLSNYGTYLVIVCKPKNGSGNSTMYFWGRSTTLTTLQAVFDLGVGDAHIVENLENQLFVIMTTSTLGNYSVSSTASRYLYVKMYTGGSTPTLYQVPITSTITPNNLKLKVNDSLFFGFGNDTALYRLGKNKSGTFVLTKDVAYPEANMSMAGISRIRDTFWLSYSVSGTYKLKRTLDGAETPAYTTTASYTTTYNPSMVLEDRYRKKKLIAVQVSFTGSATGTATLYLSVDGSAMKSCLSSTLNGEKMVDTSKYTDSTPFLEGSEFQFKFTSTGNVKLKEIRYRYDTLNNQDL